MKAILYITIEATLLKKAKMYAAKKGLSLSELVEDHFRILTRNKEEQSLLDILDSMPKPELTFTDDFDFKKEYHEERRPKYGFKNKC